MTVWTPWISALAIQGTDAQYEVSERPENSDYDSLTTIELVAAVGLEESVMAPGGSGHMFCSALYFRNLVTSLGGRLNKS